MNLERRSLPPGGSLSSHIRPWIRPRCPSPKNKALFFLFIWQFFQYELGIESLGAFNMFGKALRKFQGDAINKPNIDMEVWRCSKVKQYCSVLSKPYTKYEKAS